MSAPRDFIDAYLECALWSSCEYDEDGNNGTPLDDNYDIGDIAQSSLNIMVDDCNQFWDENESILEKYLDRSERLGHDFWLTRNRHGAGFWDGPYDDADGRALTEAAHVYGECYLYVADDQVHVG